MSESLSVPAPPTKKQAVAIVSSDLAVEEFLRRMINLSDAGVFHDPQCPICRSTHRSASEKDWLQHRNAEQVRQYFLDKGEPFTIPVIKNHMEAHVDQSQVELRKREYIDRIISLSRKPVTTMERLEIALAAIQERLVAVNAIEDPSVPSSQVEKIKADATCKLTSAMNSLLELRAEMLGELKQNGEVFTVDKRAFASAFEKLLLECLTNEEKLVVNKVFTELSKISKEY